MIRCTYTAAAGATKSCWISTFLIILLQCGVAVHHVESLVAPDPPPPSNNMTRKKQTTTNTKAKRIQQTFSSQPPKDIYNTNTNQQHQHHPIIQSEWIQFAPHNYIDHDDQMPEHYITNFGRRWYERLLETRAYKAKHGDCRVPIITDTNNINNDNNDTNEQSYNYKGLANWVVNQRVQYDYREAGKRSSLTDERFEALNQLDFCWEVHEQGEWMVRYRHLVEYKDTYGHCNLPQKGIAAASSYVTNNDFNNDRDRLLGDWVNKQRNDYRRRLLLYNNNNNNNNSVNHNSNIMSEDRVQLLESIGFIWNCNDEQWKRRFEELVEYQKEHGDCNVSSSQSSSSKKYRGLAKWVQHQRMLHRRSSKEDDDDSASSSVLTEDRRRALDSIGFCWDYKDYAWNQRFNELVAYKKIYGNCNVPFEYTDNPSLGFWVSEQRRQRRKLILEEEEKEGGYNKKSGSRKKRKSRSSAALTRERIHALEEIGFCWNRLEAAWEERYQELVEYKAKYGDCNVPQQRGGCALEDNNDNHNHNPGLAVWVGTQRIQYRKFKGPQKQKSHMTERRVEALENIGFVWSCR